MWSQFISFLKPRVSHFEQLAFVKGIDYRYDDVDCLSVSYPYESSSDLVVKLHLLGIKLAERSAGVEQSDVAILKHPTFLQPKFTTVFDTRVHVLVGLDCITISVRPGKGGRLSLSEVNAALDLDARLANIHLRKLEQPLTMEDFVREQAAHESDA